MIAQKYVDNPNMQEIENTAIGITQDWENECTIYIFEDSSVLKDCAGELTAYSHILDI